MKKLIYTLSRTHELIIVLSLAFGWFIYVSNINFINYVIPSETTLSVNYFRSNLGYFGLLILELVVLGLLAPFLEARNWRTKDFPFKFNFKILGAGILLLFSINFILNLTSLIPFVEEFLIAKSSVTHQNSANTGFAMVILTAVILNPFFEEIFLIGYLGKWFEKHSAIVFVIVSTLIRVSYHTYQGYFGIYTVTIMGLVFAMYYLKYKNLTPIVLAHMLFNLNIYIRLFYFNEESP